MLLNDIKRVLRISEANTAFDTEITDLIEAARHDLFLSGVLSSKVNSDTDPLIKRAVSVYVKANFGYDNPDADRLRMSYESLKAHLTLSQEYTVEVTTP
ncbi:head-tail connector protein [Paenibacillus sedimenti]|uniref:DNA-packaging protein n=1 Tax=Paenibacillus sedimenti TaxID=2770274 RepID=A0A926KNV5_9BACL|nr:head-tail connector protein [Paenibacillus sedimenti]MBD0381289.1 DNA-packaging protein [Paenibacillus sedimenti]